MEPFNHENPQTKVVGGVVVPHTEESWHAFEASRAPTLSAVKQAIVEMKKQKENGGLTFNGVKIATDAEAIGDVLGGLGQTGTILTDSGQRLVVNQNTVSALKSAIEDYRFKVKEYAATLVTGAESSNDLSAFMASLDSGWPTNVYPL